MRGARVTHLRFVYHLPSWQGGDVAQPRCSKPGFGTAGRAAVAGLALTARPRAVTCSKCLAIMAGVPFCFIRAAA